MFLRPLVTRFAATALTLTATVALSGIAARAQAPSIVLFDGSDSAKRVDQNILLRPNTASPYYAFVENNSDNDRTVTAVLWLLEPRPRELARSASISVPAKAKMPVMFKGDEKPIGLAGNKLRLQLLDDTNKEISKVDFELVRRFPTEYAHAEPKFEGKWDGNNALTVTVSLISDRGQSKAGNGEPVKFKLDLSRIAGLNPESLGDDVALTAQLKADDVQNSAVLVARNLRFTSNPTLPNAPPSIISVTVDGYERAFLFESKFDGPNPTDLKLKKGVNTNDPTALNHVTIHAAPASKSTDKFPVRVEINKPSSFSKTFVQLGFNRSNLDEKVNKFAFSNQTRPLDREWTANLKLGAADGAIVFGSQVRDWTFEEDATGILGRRTLRARFFGPGGDPDDPTKVTILGESEVEVAFDDSPPLATISAPAEHPRGTPLPVSVTASAKSGIDKVLFFVGEPPAPTVVNPVAGKVFLGTPPSVPNGPFTARLPMPDTKGHVVIGARVINGASKFIDKTAELDLIEPVVKTKPTTGEIKGKVGAGSASDPRPQANIDVYLLDEKQSKVIKSTKSNDKSEYEFKDLPPGNYVVYARKPIEYTSVKAPAEVKAGETTVKDVVLHR